jgi:hypothetical protein
MNFTQEPTEEVRLARRPTCAASTLALSVGYEVFEHKGGARPYYGLHYKNDGILTLSFPFSWDALVEAFRETLDKNGINDLDIFVYNGDFATSAQRIETFKAAHARVEDILLNPIHRVRVYQFYSQELIDLGDQEEEIRLRRSAKCAGPRFYTNPSFFTVGYELYTFHYGAPPYCGYHFSSNALVTLMPIPFSTTTGPTYNWEQLANAIKLGDFGDRYDLRIVLYEGIYEENNVFQIENFFGS